MENKFIVVNVDLKADASLLKKIYASEAGKWLVGPAIPKSTVKIREDYIAFVLNTVTLKFHVPLVKDEHGEYASPLNFVRYFDFLIYAESIERNEKLCAENIENQRVTISSISSSQSNQDKHLKILYKQYEVQPHELHLAFYKPKKT